MSDLHRAVQARVTAHTPAVAPSFDALKQRKRARDRRRYAVTGGALSVVVVSAASFASLDDSGDRLTPPSVSTPSQDQEKQSFTIRPRHKSPHVANVGQGLQDCLELPGAEPAFTQLSQPPQHSVTVTGAGEINAFESCVNAVPGYYAERQEEPVVHGYTPPRVEVRVGEPAVAGEPVRIEALIRDERDVAVHRVEFGDGIEQIVRFTCASEETERPAPADPQIHLVHHTWKEPGAYTVTLHYGPPCGEATSSVAHDVTVVR
jgi:hypothetical protein